MANIGMEEPMKTAANLKPTLKRRSFKKAIEVGTRGPLESDHGHSYTATEAKNEFGRVLDRALQGETVIITKHDAPRAVLISMDKFHALQQAPQLKLSALSSEFDDLLLRRQTAPARAGMERAFNASTKQLGKAAVDAVRKRG
jgi:antitoxin Phd